MKAAIKKKYIYAVLAAALLFWAWNSLFPYALNYRITVEIETPEGVKSGSAVRRVIAAKTLAFNPDVRKIRSNIFGEAVVVDLGKRGVIFALINWSSYEELYEAFAFDGDEFGPEGIRYYRSLKPGTRAELKTYIPKLVTFTDINDPKSVKLVKGYRFNVKTQKFVPVDNFEEIFGKGVHLKRVMIEITNDPVTWGIVDKYRPSIFNDGFEDWWKTLKGSEKMKLSDMYSFKKGAAQW